MPALVERGGQKIVYVGHRFATTLAAARLLSSTVRAMQVLDDSTCKATRALVDDKVLEWKERGVNVDCIRRTNRQGYKAGALKEVGFTTGLLVDGVRVKLRELNSLL